MKLTKEEIKMLNGEKGKAVKKSMEILVALGEIYGAERLIPVSSVQISGVSYDNLGDAGLEFLLEMAHDGKVCVKTTLNPIGMDRYDWRSLGIDDSFAKKQIMILNAFEKMGVDTTCTCTPYLIGNRPSFGDHIAWGESSAVTFANSVLGARTNKEGGPSTIASALTGRTPEYGLHLDENRNAHFIANIHANIDNPMLFGVVGSIIGKISRGRIPLIRGIKRASEDDLKALSASIVTYGSAPMFHIEGITKNKTTIPDEIIDISENDINKQIEEMTDGKEPDFIFIGCPHCSLEEIEKIAKFLKGKKVKKELWIGISRDIKKIADDKGYSKIIEESGAKFACDTCHVVAPIKGRFCCMATNSSKGVYYGRGKNSFNTMLLGLEGCLKMAV